ncbi:hypothetical protein LP420_10450 [Massilia sp. B-10]|nr:hypothetical protein LP420_10450 [Massilia sp. B-10]
MSPPRPRKSATLRPPVLGAHRLAAGRRGLVHGDRGQHFLGRGQALLGEVFRADRGDRQRGLGRQALDGRAGDFNPLHRFVGGLLGLRGQRQQRRAEGGTA